MKLIFKNSTILFQNKNYQEVSSVSVLNSPTSFYVYGSTLGAGASGGGNELYVKVYPVSAGETYYVKSLPGEVIPNSQSSTSSVTITFGTNLLSSTGVISNPQVIKTITIKDTTLSDFNVEFTPEQNGYIYVTEINEASLPAVCLSSVFV